MRNERENGEGNQRDKESYRPADGWEAVEVKREETERLERGSIAVRIRLEIDGRIVLSDAY